MNMLTKALSRKKQLILATIKKFGASDLQVFGSVAKDEEQTDSYIEILISLPKGYDMFDQRIPLQQELEMIIGCPIIMLVKHELNKHFKSAILAEAQDF